MYFCPSATSQNFGDPDHWTQIFHGGQSQHTSGYQNLGSLSTDTTPFQEQCANLGNYKNLDFIIPDFYTLLLEWRGLCAHQIAQNLIARCVLGVGIVGNIFHLSERVKK